MDSRTIYLVRHGDTAANAESAGPELERGWKPYPLDAEGRSEAKRIAEKLSKFGIRTIRSSDLPRAKQTADIIGDWLGITPEFDRGLRTWNTGQCAGKTKKSVEPHIAHMVRYQPDEACSGGESFDSFCNRARKALIGATKESDQSYPMAIIIHARVERLFAATDEFEHRKVNADVFLAKPEQPGHIEKWTVSPGARS
jgi:broad specificity phosphatase PhoE